MVPEITRHTLLYHQSHSLYTLNLTSQMFAGSKDFVGLVLFGTPGLFIDIIVHRT